MSSGNKPYLTEYYVTHYNELKLLQEYRVNPHPKRELSLTSGVFGEYMLNKLNGDES
jgi:hypothetical protein